MSCRPRVVAVLAFCLLSVGCGLSGPSFEEQAEEASVALEAELRLIASSMELEVLEVSSTRATKSSGGWFRQDLEGAYVGPGVVRLELSSIGESSEPADLQGLVDVLAGLGYELHSVSCSRAVTWGIFGSGGTDGIRVIVRRSTGKVGVWGEVDEHHRRVGPSEMEGIDDDGGGCWPHPS